MTDNDKALVERLREATIIMGDRVKAADRIEAQAAEIERLKKALRFYSGWGVISPDYDEVVREDSGETARSALGEMA